jgi:hypothetical protein
MSARACEHSSSNQVQRQSIPRLGCHLSSFSRSSGSSNGVVFAKSSCIALNSLLWPHFPTIHVSQLDHPEYLDLPSISDSCVCRVDDL